MNHRLLYLVALIACTAVPQPALAGKVQCAIDPRTDAHQCIAPSELRETDGIRWAPLYAGGPKGVSRTAFTAHANCRTQVLHLKDRFGVSFGGGDFSDTPMAKQLGGLLCNTALPTRKTKG
jgi:hypothetical protein